MTGCGSNDQGRATVTVDIAELRRGLADCKERINSLPLTGRRDTQQRVKTASVGQCHVGTALQQFHYYVTVTSETSGRQYCTDRTVSTVSCINVTLPNVTSTFIQYK